MKRRNTEALRDVIYRALRQSGLETPLNEHRAVSLWPQIAGSTIALLTTDVQLRDGTMYIKISRPALRQDLSMMHTQLAQRINERVGANVVNKIVFY